MTVIVPLNAVSTVIVVAVKLLTVPPRPKSPKPRPPNPPPRCPKGAGRPRLGDLAEGVDGLAVLGELDVTANALVFFGVPPLEAAAAIP